MFTHVYFKTKWILISTAGAAKAAKEDEAAKFQIVDYISKTKFSIGKPKGKEDLYGYGLIKSGPDHR